MTSKQEIDVIVNKAIKKKLKQVQELKSFDTGLSTSADSTGALQKISTIPQDDSDSGRDGDALHVMKVELRVSFVPADTTNVIRLVVFRWMQDDSSAAPSSATDVLQTANPYSPYNRDNYRAKKFLVLDDYLSAVGLAGPCIDKHHVDKNTQFNITYQSSATTGNSQIYVLRISDSTASTHPTVSYVARVWYTDS